MWPPPEEGERLTDKIVGDAQLIDLIKVSQLSMVIAGLSFLTLLCEETARARPKAQAHGLADAATPLLLAAAKAFVLYVLLLLLLYCRT